jgi:CxxC motif-containing protein (DUF1111 family)
MMKRFLFTTAISVTCAVLAIGMLVGAPPPPEAPAGFDGVTNGSIAQSTMDADVATFSEIDQPTPDGLGPVYNAVSCLDCHQSVAIGGASQVLEFRAGHNDGSRPPSFRSQRATFDTNGSAGQFVAATAITANGTPIPDRSLINQRAICSDAVEHLTDVDNIRASRLSLSVLGDGFVEAVPDSTFRAIAANNHGEAIDVPVLEANGITEVGKFGWKDQHASLLSFSGDAYVNEIGVTNRLFPDESTAVCEPSSGLTTPNDTGDDIDQFAAFMRATKVPPRGPITPAVMQGQAIFEQIGCNNCHVETLVTAPAGTTIHGGMYMIPGALGGKQIHPFGDFLLHNIGTGDGIVQNGPEDTQYKVRTMPLWGLRTRTQLMHDAQSSTYSDAIERHGGEAAGEASKFNQLTPAQKALLYAFLGSL